MPRAGRLLTFEDTSEIENYIRWRFHDLTLLRVVFDSFDFSVAISYRENVKSLSVLGEEAIHLALLSINFTGRDRYGVAQGDISHRVAAYLRNANICDTDFAQKLKRYMVSDVSDQTIEMTVLALLGAVYLDSNLDMYAVIEKIYQWQIIPGLPEFVR